MSRILIVDDEKSIRYTLSRFISNSGYEVSLAGSAEEAVELFRDNKFDAVLTDIIMPKMTGIDLLKVFRETDPGVPVVLMTGNPTIETASESVRSRAFDYLAKPIDKETVLSVIDKIEKERKEKTELSNQLQQSQRMVAIGTLAAGIVHDFNNLLIPIVGYTQLAIGDAEPGSDLYNYLSKALVGSSRAGELISQILGFSLKIEITTTTTKVKPILEEVISFLGPTFPTDVEVEQQLESDSLVLGSPIQIHQVLINLCANAIHAMSHGGGRLSVIFQDTAIEKETDFSGFTLSPGKYVKLTVSDTGHGISEDEISNIFSPFYTTKEPGSGSGLGLSVVSNIVKELNGNIEVISYAGKGSSFNIYLPAVKKDEDSGQTSIKPVVKEPVHVLYVDDEEPIVAVGKLVLEKLGFIVTVCTSPTKALEIFKENTRDFDIVITDYKMPDMDGETFARKICAISPDLLVIICTG